MIVSRVSAFALMLTAPTVAVAADIPRGPGTSAALAVGAPASSDLNSTTDADWFRVSVQAGKLYAFTVATSAAGDDLGFRLSAGDAKGRVIAAADLPTRGDWETKQLNFRPKTAGTHYLEVTLTQPRPVVSRISLDYQVGLFRDVSSSFDDAARLPFGRQVTASLQSSNDVDYYVVWLEKGKPVDVLASVYHEDTVNLYDRDRKFLDLVDANWGKLAYHVPTYTGDHFISVSRRFGGDFTLRVAPADRGRPSPGMDLLIGTDDPDVIDALGGDDQVRGLAGNDVLRGGPGDNTIFGGAGDDRVIGAETYDHLFGEGGDDVLIGGRGFLDDLSGGPGADRFVFAGDAARGYDSGSRSDPDPYKQGTDIVNDFAAGDRIDLRGVDADAIKPRWQPFTFVGTAPFSGPGQVRYGFEPAGVGETMTVIALSTDADPAAEMEILLMGRHALRAGDFTLRAHPRTRR